MDLSWVNLRKNLSVCSKFWLCGRRLAQGGCEQGESGRRFCQSGQRFSLFQVHSTLGKTSPIYSSLIIIFRIKLSTSLKGSPQKPNKTSIFSRDCVQRNHNEWGPTRWGGPEQGTSRPKKFRHLRSRSRSSLSLFSVYNFFLWNKIQSGQSTEC